MPTSERMLTRSLQGRVHSWAASNSGRGGHRSVYVRHACECVLPVYKCMHAYWRMHAPWRMHPYKQPTQMCLHVGCFDFRSWSTPEKPHDCHPLISRLERSAAWRAAARRRRSKPMTPRKSA
eukprot:6190262-Pleurochrysis_carterae.AAC.2